MTTKKIETIYVYLSDEGIDAWRPVEAEVLGEDRYRIISEDNALEEEKWEFAPGDIVLCERKVLSDANPHLCLVAVSKE